MVFTKSALVMTGRAATRAAQIPRLLRPGGEYIGVENLQGGWLVRRLRHDSHSDPTFPSRFSPITPEVMSILIESFANVETRHIVGPVIALRAIKSAVANRGAGTGPVRPGSKDSSLRFFY